MLTRLLANLSSTLLGTTTNDNAAAGVVGEYVQSTFSAVALTTNTVTNLTSISLTAGDWDVYGNALIGASAVALFEAVAGINTVSATFGTYYAQILTASGGALAQTISQTMPPQRLSLASTTTVYAVGRAQFASGTAAATGILLARRVR